LSGWLKNMAPDEQATELLKRVEARRARSRRCYYKDVDKTRAHGRCKAARYAPTQNAKRRAEHAVDKTKERAKTLRKKYGLSLVGWLSRLHFQDERCACCRASTAGHKNGWHTDHDHDTGQVRGLLCNRCNRLIGALGDRADSVRRECSRFLVYLGGVQ
jgi:hypothetical protein